MLSTCIAYQGVQTRIVGGLPSGKDLRGNLRRSISARCTGSSPDESDLSAPIVSSGTDWREFRAQLVAKSKGSVTGAGSSAAGESWAHTVPGPEKGCILVASPLMFNSTQTYFDKSITLIFQHTDQGSAGLIINKPSDVYLRDLDLEPLLPQYQDNLLYVGGDVGESAMQMIHGRNVEGATEVLKGVFLGGQEVIGQMVSDGELKGTDVKWFARYCGWGAGQLEAECQRNVWFPASCSSDVVLDKIEKDGCSLWHKVMEMLGDDFGSISREMKALEKKIRDGSEDGGAGI